MKRLLITAIPLLIALLSIGVFTHYDAHPQPAAVVPATPCGREPTVTIDRDPPFTPHVHPPVVSAPSPEITAILPHVPLDPLDLGINDAEGVPMRCDAGPDGDFFFVGRDGVVGHSTISCLEALHDWHDTVVPKVHHQEWI